MYSPTTRLLTILELLQSHKEMSGAELARRLEVDRRTVRRYIVMLQDMGIPVEAERGPDGAYHLRRGYKLPPLMFTDAEAVALTLGLLVMRAYRLPVDVVAIEGALAKTERVMPEKLFDQARGLQDAITFNVAPPPTNLQPGFVSLLSAAVQQNTRVFLRYLAFNGDESERTFDPYGIVFNEGYWYTVGYCHKRQDLRTFRMDRITALDLLDQPFEPPREFNTLEHVLSAIATMSGGYKVEILLRAPMEQLRQLFTPEAGIFEESAEGVIWRRETHELGWVLHVVMSFDFPVIIRQPPELRAMLRDHAAKALRMVEAE